MTVQCACPSNGNGCPESTDEKDGPRANVAAAAPPNPIT